LINDLAWSANGNLLAVSAGDQLHLFTADTWTETLTIPTNIWAARIAFHPTLPLIAAAMRDGAVRFWNIKDGQEVCSFIAHQKNTYSLAFRPDGKILGTTGNDIISRLWDISALNNGECNIREDYQLIANSYNSSDLTFAPGNDLFAVVDIRDIRVRENESHKLFRLFQTDEVILDLAFSFDGRHLAAAQPESVIRIWDVTTPDSEPVILQDENRAAFVWRVAFSPDNITLAASDSAGRVALWDFAAPRVLTTYQHPRAVSALAFSPNGRWLASGGLDAVVRLWRVK
jgi:WD40 repeat protein